MPILQPPTTFSAGLSPSLRVEVSLYVQGAVSCLTGGTLPDVPIQIIDKETRTVVRTLTTDRYGRFQVALIQKSTGYHFDAKYPGIWPPSGFDVYRNTFLNFIVPSGFPDSPPGA